MLAGKNNASSAARRLPNREAALDQLYSEISAKHMFPFWATSTDVAHDEIKQLMGTQKAVPHLWSYKHDIEPILFRAAELVTMDDSERRSLILINPGLAPKRATVSTMYTAYRLNDPHEVMPPHKHSPSAIRFGLTGNGTHSLRQIGHLLRISKERVRQIQNRALEKLRASAERVGWEPSLLLGC